MNPRMTSPAVSRELTLRDMELEFFVMQKKISVITFNMTLFIYKVHCNVVGVGEVTIE